MVHQCRKIAVLLRMKLGKIKLRIRHWDFSQVAKIQYSNKRGPIKAAWIIKLLETRKFDKKPSSSESYIPKRKRKLIKKQILNFWKPKSQSKRSISVVRWHNYYPSMIFNYNTRLILSKIIRKKKKKPNNFL